MELNSSQFTESSLNGSQSVVFFFYTCNENFTLILSHFTIYFLSFLIDKTYFYSSVIILSRTMSLEETGKAAVNYCYSDVTKLDFFALVTYLTTQGKEVSGVCRRMRRKLCSSPANSCVLRISLYPPSQGFECRTRRPE